MFTNLIDKIDNRINPIVVKEIRQYLSGRVIIPLILLTSLLELGAMFMFMASQYNNIDGRGQEFFSTIMIVLSLACLFGIGFPTIGRISRERNPEPDLMYATIMSPFKIVSGKFFSGMTMVILMISLCLPFMCVSYYLRGIDLPTILIAVYWLFIISIPCLMGMVLFGLLCASVVYRILMFFVALSTFFTIVSSIETLMRGLSFTGSDIALILFWVTFIMLLITGCLYVLAVAAISHITSNRAMPVKLYLTGAWLLSLLAILTMVSDTAARKNAIEMWAVIACIAIFIYIPIAICERDEQSRRVLRRVPKNIFGRCFFFLFSSGSAGGLTFILAGIILTLIISGSIYPSYSDNKSLSFGGIAMYCMSYAFIDTSLKNWLKRHFSWIHPLAIFLVMSSVLIFLPLLISFIIHQERCLESDNSAMFMLFSPAIFGFNGYAVAGFFVSAILLLIGMLVMSREFFRQLKQYFPARQQETTVTEPITAKLENVDA